MSKLSANLPGIHDISSMASTGKRAIPHSAKSAYLELFMHQNRKNRLIAERDRLTKKLKQIKKKLAVIDKEMAELLEVAEKKDNPGPAGSQKKTRGVRGTVISY